MASEPTDDRIDVAAVDPEAELRRAEILTALYRKRLQLAQEIRDAKFGEQTRLQGIKERAHAAMQERIQATEAAIAGLKEKLDEADPEDEESRRTRAQLEREFERKEKELAYVKDNYRRKSSEDETQVRAFALEVKQAELEADEAQTLLQLAQQSIAQLAKRVQASKQAKPRVQIDVQPSPELLATRPPSRVNLDAEDAAAELERARLLAAGLEARLTMLDSIRKTKEETQSRIQELYETGMTPKSQVDAAELAVIEAKLATNDAKTQLSVIQAAAKRLTERIANKNKESDASKVRPSSQNASRFPSVEPPKPDPLAAVSLSKNDLADCELHVVGVYQASREDNDDQIYVDVKPTGNPMVVVVSAYSEALWRIRIDPEANVKLVIVAGYFAQVATVIESDVPMITLTYFQQDDKVDREPWAYAVAWNTDEGRKMARMLHDITGLTASTFQGMESARYLILDGKRGKLTNRQAKEPIPGLLSDAEKRAEPVQFPEIEPDEVGQRSRPSIFEVDFEESVEATNLGLNQLTDGINEISQRLDSLESELVLLTKAGVTGKGEVPDQAKAKIKALLQKQFDLEQEKTEARVNASILKIQLVKLHRAFRERRRDEILQQRLKKLTDD
ncbi:MAG: hypothetical protein AAGD07_17200 [Planctomycetota bacterium]